MNKKELKKIQISLPLEIQNFYKKKAKELNLPYTNFISLLLINLSQEPGLINSSIIKI